MSEETLPALANIPSGEVQKFDDSIFNAVASSGDWLPRLQLMIANSEQCKSGDFPINNFALINGNVLTDLGGEIDIVVIAFRPKALDISDGTVLSVFDPKLDDSGNPSGEFARIQEASNTPNSGCMFGPEFLVYVPKAEQFATFFMGSKSSRRESPKMKDRLKKAATLTSHKIETAKFTWYSPLIQPCSQALELPDPQAILTELEKFNSPPEQEIEKAKDDTSGRER